MFIDDWLKSLEPAGTRAVVFAAGGGADIIFARFIAERLRIAGATRVDLAQALNRASIDLETAERFQLIDVGRTDTDQIKRFDAIVPNDHRSDGVRGKGAAIAAAIRWRHGDRLAFAANGEGCAMLAQRAWAVAEPYDFAVAVDGGGDILTGGPANFDRVVLERFRRHWDAQRPIALLVIGLGADCASPPEAFANATLDGWHLAHETTVDSDAADAIDHTLQTANRFHPDPSVWRTSDLHWSRGLHVPQIVSMAARSELPSSRRGHSHVLVPRGGKGAAVAMEQYEGTGQLWPVLNGELLRTARWYRPG